MPTVIYKKSELKKLIEKKISDEQLEEVITLIKPNLEKTEGENITIEHTADRIDLFGAEGMARAISSYLGFKRGLPKFKISKPKLEVKMSSVPARPYVSAAVVRGVKMDEDIFESLINLQELLNDSIGRKRSKSAIGIHDLDKIKGTISYKGVSRDVRMIPLDSSKEMSMAEVLEKTEKGKKYGGLLKSVKLLPAFCDANGVMSFPPLINSSATSITENTKNFFVEITGTDKKTVRDTMSVFITNLAERYSIEGVKLKFEKKSEVTPNLSENVSEVKLDMINKTLGLNLSMKDVIELLARMGYDVVGTVDKIEAISPAFRTDILHPIDVVEDVAIAYGYNNFNPELPNISTIGKPLEIEKISERASNSLVGFGFQEIISSILSNPRDQFEKTSISENNFIEIENPSSSEHTCARISLVPGILKFLSENRHYEYPQNIFEVGDVVVPDKTEETFARNERRIAGAICHSRAGFSEMKLIVDNLIKNLGLGYTLKECESGMYIPDRGVDVFIDKKFAGSFGELHPQVIQNWEIGMPVSVFEINLERG